MSSAIAINSETETQKKHIGWIDTVKGIGILSVILGHMGNKNLTLIVGLFHVPVFFIVSGYLMKTEKLDTAQINKRFDRLIRPYLYTCFCAMAIDVFTLILRGYSVFDLTGKVWTDLVKCFMASGDLTQVLGIEMNTRVGAIWFLPALFTASLIAQFIFSCFSSWKMRWLLSYGLFILSSVSAQFVWLPFSLQPAMMGVLFIAFGVWFRERDLVEHPSAKVKYVMYILTALGILFSLWTGRRWISFVRAYAFDLFSTPVMVSAACFTVMRIASIAPSFKAINYIGNRSLQAMCLHLIFLETLGPHRNYLFEMAGIDAGFFINFIYNTTMVYIGVFVLDLLKNRYINKDAADTDEADNTGRDTAIDLMRSILIILMMIGHLELAPGFRRLLYSTHMTAFILISGYFYRTCTRAELGVRLRKMLLGLLKYYCVLAVLFITVKAGSSGEKLKILTLCMSFSRKLFPSVSSIGPVYFIFMIFMTRLIYTFSEVLAGDQKRCMTVCLLLSVSGVLLGTFGFWMPWSLDTALYCLIYFEAGVVYRKYNIEDLFSRNRLLMIVPAILLAYMVWTGSMELAVRNYPFSRYGIVVLGSVSGFILLHQLCIFINNRISSSVLIRLIGENTGYILMIHTLFRPALKQLFEGMLHLSSTSNVFVFLNITIQILLGIILGRITDYLFTRFVRRRPAG